jgi:geranylgeranyl diphosphate synthase type II
MDDADLRRSQPTIHIAFDESTAVLAATALLNRAFGIISRMQDISAETRINLVDMLSTAVGSKGLIAGQIADLSNDEETVSITQVEEYNRLKTGALFDFSILGAATLGQASETTTNHLTVFSEQLGLAFQLLDDLKDKVMSSDETGKSDNRDIGKMTILALTDDKAAMARTKAYLDAAMDALNKADLSTTDLINHALRRQFKFLYR